MAEIDPTHIHFVVAQIPFGRVASYGEIAAKAGYAGKARWVGKVMSQLPEDSGLPWHRVLNSQGIIRAPQSALARQRLLAEGIDVNHNRVDMKRFRWDGAIGTNLG